jgi:hypothetical protein
MRLADLRQVLCQRLEMPPLKLRITELPVTPDRLLSWIRAARGG